MSTSEDPLKQRLSIMAFHGEELLNGVMPLKTNVRNFVRNFLQKGLQEIERILLQRSIQNLSTVITTQMVIDINR